MTKNKDFYSEEFQKNARLGEYWYDEIWKNVEKCPFCDLKEKYIITERKGIVLTVNLFPYVDNHMMIIPREHVLSITDLNDVERQTVWNLSILAGELLEKEGIPGYKFLVREGDQKGKTVEHLHFHIIPGVADLEKWDYREIEVAPADTAVKLREVLSGLNSSEL